MEAIESPDSHHLSAAVGWLELGNHREARLELSKIMPELLAHPDVMEVNWAIYAQERDWDAALEVSRALLQCDPHRPSAWLHQAYALRRAKGGGIKAAWEALLPALDGFPSEPAVPYNLSCYACQMGELDHARCLLHEAVRRGDRKTIKAMALQDDDLQPLWREISRL